MPTISLRAYRASLAARTKSLHNERRSLSALEVVAAIRSGSWHGRRCRTLQPPIVEVSRISWPLWLAAIALYAFHVLPRLIRTAIGGRVHVPLWVQAVVDRVAANVRFGPEADIERITADIRSGPSNTSRKDRH